MKTRLAQPAREQAERIDRWWRENRPAASDTFARELNEARFLLANTPEMGSPYQERHGALIRRVLLPKSRNQLYYEIDRPNGVVMILAVWGAPRGSAPEL